MLGVMPQLKSLGYGVFEKEAVDKDPIWPDLLSDNPKTVKAAISLIREHEPDIVAAAESQESYNQLQPIRVQQLDDGTYDVLGGMTRCLARALNYVESPKTCPDTIEAVVVDISKVKEVDKLFMAFADNNDRRQEGVIDKALFFSQMKKEHKLTPDDIGKRVGYTGQSIRDYFKMLHPKLQDKQQDIQNGMLSIDKAKKMLSKRLEGEDGEDTNGTPPSGDRARLPGVKRLESAYSSKKKPDWMEQKVWEWFVSDATRQFIGFYLGKKFKPFNGEIQAPEEKPKALKLSIPKKKAIRLMIALGREEAADWDNVVLKEKLENIPNQMEAPDLKLDDESLQTLLEKLVKHYSTGIEVFIKE
jgi:ParB-like chromosome segregation protein Spo0J